MKKTYLFIIFSMFIYPLTIWGIDKNSIQDELNLFKSVVQSSIKNKPTSKTNAKQNTKLTNISFVSNNSINNQNNQSTTNTALIPDHGLLFTKVVFTNSGNLGLTPEADKVFMEIQKLSDEEIKKNLNSDDYLLRIFSYIWLCWKTQSDNFTLTYPTDTKWEDYIRPLLIDLYYAVMTDRKEEFPYLDFETDSVHMIFNKLGKTSFPGLKKILMNKKENIIIRKLVLGIFSMNFYQEPEIINILHEVVNDEVKDSEITKTIMIVFKDLMKKK